MKKILSYIICIVLLISAFTFTAAADEFTVLTQPTVFISGENEYNIVWVTDVPTAAFVELTYNGTTYVYADEMSGITRTDDYTHTVRVPKTALDSAKGYTIISRTVSENGKSGITYDSEMRSDYSFTPYTGKEEIRFGFFSDLHLRPAEFTRLEYAKTILKNNLGECDVIVLNGDITDAMTTENYLTETLLEASHQLSGGTLPVIYVRGNHECRGEYAQYINRYLAFDTGEFYGKISYGPISAIIADCGEDKADHRTEYGALVDFDNYLASEALWLETMGGYDTNAGYRLGISHSPKVIDRLYTTDATDAMVVHGTDIVVGGHYHTAQLYEDIAFYPTVTDGGLTENGYRAGVMIFKNGTIDFEVYNEKGENVFGHTEDIVREPEQSNTGAGGLTQSSIKGASASATVEVGPTVFDCGDNYNIVYMTDAGSELSKAEAVIEKDGKTYTFTDSVSGNAASDLLHSITVPKSILEGSVYTLKTTYLASYGAYGTEIAYDGVYTDIGCTVTSQKYSFPEFESGGALEILSVSDMKDAAKDAAKIKNSLTDTPDVIIVGGDMAEGLYTRDDFVKNILTFTSALSTGETPVILCRGSGESYGDYAPYISEMLRMDKMYFTTCYGDTNIIVCDTAVTSEIYSQKQTEWIKTLKLKGSKTFIAASDKAAALNIAGESFNALGCVAVLGESGEYGSYTLLDSNGLTQSDNSFAGIKHAAAVQVNAAVSQERTDTAEYRTVQYRTDEQKKEDIGDDPEVIEQKPTDLSRHMLILYQWTARGLDTTLPKAQVTDMGCTQFLVAYANLSGVKYDSIDGTNTQSKSINWAHSVGIISYLPPIMHRFTAEEINTILSK